MSHIPPEGYEDAAFFGRNCQSCLRPEDGTPHEAAERCASRLLGSYIIEGRDGWTVYAQLGVEELSTEMRSALDDWLAEPIEAKVARWKREISQGKRTPDGRWIGGLRQRRQEGDGQTE